jgi:glycosyltransferase involved in cell wall biosynthesis
MRLVGETVKMIEEGGLTLVEKGTPLISVVLPVYNGESYLAEAIESILAQSFVNFELIIIDDGSTDGSQKILREFELRDERVRVFMRENKGLATTLNDSIGVARGAWIARMDQDDIALPHRFERQLQWLEQTGADICGSWVRFFGTEGERVWKCYRTDQAIKMDMLFRSPFAHPSVIMRTDIAKHYSYRKEFEKAEDFDLWVRCALAGLKMTNVPEVLLMYRIHSSQTSSISTIRQQELTSQLQRDYWTFMMNYYNFGYNGHDIVKLKNLQNNIDMEIVDATLLALLKRNQGEAVEAIMENVSWLYMRAATEYPSMILRWKNLQKQSGLGRNLSTLGKLYLIKILKARRGDAVFVLLKRLYYFIVK